VLFTNKGCDGISPLLSEGSATKVKDELMKRVWLCLLFLFLLQQPQSYPPLPFSCRFLIYPTVNNCKTILQHVSRFPPQLPQLARSQCSNARYYLNSPRISLLPPSNAYQTPPPSYFDYSSSLHAILPSRSTRSIVEAISSIPRGSDELAF